MTETDAKEAIPPESASDAPEPDEKQESHTNEEEAAENYEYEDLDKSTPAGGQTITSTLRTVQRRNVMKADEAIYNVSYHPGRVLAYSPPRQRQKWGEAQSLPRVNWGDLFFDLHYVAATYNISYQLVADPTWEGLLYAAGTFFPILQIWLNTTLRSSRYVTEDDLFHRVLQICSLVILATSVLHIRPVKIMANASGDISMFVFSLCMVLDGVLEAFKCLEERFLGIGHKVAIQNASVLQVVNVGMSLLFYVPALVISAHEFFPRTSGYSRLLAGDASDYNESSGYHGADDKSPTNLPIILILVGFMFTRIFFNLRVVFCFPKNGRHKEVMIPMNVGFFIHRSGEFVMLMLGECLFSLVIVDIGKESRDFFTTFYCGILTVIFLQYVHFQSQPHDANSHALRRHKDAGLLWTSLINIYSFALVCLGAAFTFFLTHFANEEKHRLLAGGSDAYDSETQQERSAHLFCGALAVCFATLDGMTAAHIGIDEGKKRLMSTNKRNYAGIALLCLRLAITPFIATASQWETDPTRLSMIGFVCVLAQLVLRKLGDTFLSHEQVHVLDPTISPEEEEHHWNLRQSVLLPSALVNIGDEFDDDDDSKEDLGDRASNFP